jgi:hypothetical protein
LLPDALANGCTYAHAHSRARPGPAQEAACLAAVERATGSRPRGFTSSELALALTLAAVAAGEVPPPPSAAYRKYAAALEGVCAAVYRDAAEIRCLPAAGRLDELLAAFTAHLCVDVDKVGVSAGAAAMDSSTQLDTGAVTQAPQRATGAAV